MSNVAAAGGDALGVLLYRPGVGAAAAEKGQQKAAQANAEIAKPITAKGGMTTALAGALLDIQA